MAGSGHPPGAGRLPPDGRAVRSCPTDFGGPPLCRSCHAHADDRALVGAVRRGDTDAFDELHDRYRARLERFASGMLGERRASSEDVVQDVFVRAHAALRRDERHIELAGWLFALTRNRALDELRKRTILSVPDGFEAGSNALEPSVLLQARDELGDVLTDIVALPERQRRAIVTSALDGRPTAGLAAELGISEGAAKNLTHRARATLSGKRRTRRLTGVA